MTNEIPKQYNPTEAQTRWYPFWESKGYFHSEPDAGRPAYCIVIPPPNVTGALHMGHALNGVLQDILVRWRRMADDNALWLPGTDHAGIATQAVVERRLMEEEGKTRHDLGREALVQRIWAWKDDYEARILRQFQQMGCSCDWQRTRFTLDCFCARAVRETFFRLFDKGLIYRGQRLVNWDTQLQTAVADDEIFHETVHGYLWTFRYPLAGARGSDNYVRIATTRPETMLGDTAVAVHPDDPRYQNLIGKTVLLPLVNREIPIIADPVLVDPEFGTGAVKVTPAHDPNDYGFWERHRNEMPALINILHPDGTINANGGSYQGLDRYEARRRVVEDLEKLGLVESTEPYQTDIGHSDRSKTPIEPYLSDQWFIKMADLAQAAMDAVNDGRVQIFPPRYAKTYLDWLGEKRDWCISRQLWWGHRIPVWRLKHNGAWDPKKAKSIMEAMHRLKDEHPDKISVKFFESDGTSRLPASTRAEKPPVAPAAETGRPISVHVCLGQDEPTLIHRLEELGFEQDPDVLDTWFSSALWPHSTLGWPEPTPELRYYYPTSVLVTSRDIITLWVARMVMIGLHNCGDVPFRQVYIHPKILDGQGQTMSKSKGNGVDPLDIIDKYGADALRFTLAHLTTEQQDARMPVSYECPHCGGLLPQKLEHQELRAIGGQKPRLTCPACQKDYQPSSPNFDPDPGVPVGRLVSDRFEIGQHFANKLWNAARFTLLNLESYQPGPLSDADLHLEDRWILSRLSQTAEQVTSQLSDYRFSEAARTLYDFTWGQFCDWYLEMIKPRLLSQDREAADPAARAAAQRVLAGVLDTLLRLLHPIMPFVTEEIWQRLGTVAGQRGLLELQPAIESIMIAPWPKLPGEWINPSVDAEVQHLQELVTHVRNIRASFGVPPSAYVELYIRSSDDQAKRLLELRDYLANLARARMEPDWVGPGISRPKGSAGFALPGLEGYLPLADLIDLDAERARQRKQLEKIEGLIAGMERKLANPQFLKRAPAEVVHQHRERLAELQKQRQAIATLLGQLEGE